MRLTHLAIVVCALLAPAISQSPLQDNTHDVNAKYFAAIKNYVHSLSKANAMTLKKYASDYASVPELVDYWQNKMNRGGKPVKFHPSHSRSEGAYMCLSGLDSVYDIGDNYPLQLSGDNLFVCADRAMTNLFAQTTVRAGSRSSKKIRGELRRNSLAFWANAYPKKGAKKGNTPLDIYTAISIIHRAVHEAFVDVLPASNVHSTSHL
jgi:hypothetical protein